LTIFWFTCSTTPAGGKDLASWAEAREPAKDERTKLQRRIVPGRLTIQLPDTRLLIEDLSPFHPYASIGWGELVAFDEECPKAAIAVMHLNPVG